MSTIAVESAVSVAYYRIIASIPGEYAARRGLVDTPNRAAKALLTMTSGYQVDVPALLKEFDDGGEGYDQMVLVKNIEFTSLCEHHLLPFYGVAHVAYLPKGKVYGLSKLARVVEAYARRLQVQERMTTQIAEAVFGYGKNVEGSMNPPYTARTLGAACVVKAKHLCMGCRGVLKPDAETVTSKLCGEFEKPEVRAELLALIGDV